MVGQSTLDSHFLIPKKDQVAYHWLEWIIMGGLPFSFVENEFARKNSKHEPICTKTLMKYIAALKLKVRDSIKGEIPNQFGIIFDGWSDGLGGHYVGLFASYVNKSNVVTKPLLALRPLLDETSFTAREYELFFYDVIAKYEKTIDNVVCIIGDNCSTNTSLARKLRVPLVGCASHRLNLFVKGLYSQEGVAVVEHNPNADNVDDENGGNVEIIENMENIDDNNEEIDNGNVNNNNNNNDNIENINNNNNDNIDQDINSINLKVLTVKVHSCMVKFKTLKNSAKLKEITHLRALLNNATRWSSTFAMFARYG